MAAIGTGTQAALAARGITQVHVAREFCAEGLAELLAGKVRARDRVLIARAEEARDVLPRALEEQGAQVSDVAAYRTRAVAEGAEALAAALRAGDVDAVTFTSSYTVTNLLADALELAGQRVGGPSLLEGADLYSIGPVTTETLRAAGLEPRAQAAEYTIAGLVAALVDTQEGELL